MKQESVSVSSIIHRQTAKAEGVKEQSSIFNLQSSPRHLISSPSSLCTCLWLCGSVDAATSYRSKTARRVLLHLRTSPATPTPSFPAKHIIALRTSLCLATRSTNPSTNHQTIHTGAAHGPPMSRPLAAGHTAISFRLPTAISNQQSPSRVPTLPALYRPPGPPSLH